MPGRHQAGPATFALCVIPGATQRQLEERKQDVEEEITYAEEYIGECTAGSCDRPATVRVYEDFMLCALHYMRYEAREDIDEATMALGLIKGWHSVANMHGNDYLIRMFNRASEELREIEGAARLRRAQLKRVDYENEHAHDLRTRGGLAARSEQEEAGALPELSALGRQLVALTGYPGADLTRFARDMVRTAGYGEELVPTVEARLLSADAGPLPDDFLAALADGLGLTQLGRKGLAMAYAFDEYLEDEGSPESGQGDRSCA